MKEFIRHFKIYFWIGVTIYSLFFISRYFMLAAYGIKMSELIHVSPITSFIISTSGILLTTLIIGVFLGVIDILFIKKILYKKSLLWFFTVGVSLQIVTLCVTITIVYQFVKTFVTLIPGAQFVPLNPNEFVSIIIFMMLHVVLSKFIIEVDQKLGPGNLYKMITGKFYTPQEEERIFMFIDLKNSTAIAEDLGHKKYSMLLQDCFRDISVVKHFDASVYQYVGDEVVLSWPIKKDRSYRLFLSAFFAFKKKLESREDYYMDKYNLAPKFKAGAHIGPVIVTEVGELKREITYHGDTMNTCARIQNLCNTFDSEMLISKKLFETSEKYYDLHHFEDVGEIQLKGKTETTRLYKVNEKELEEVN